MSFVKAKGRLKDAISLAVFSPSASVASGYPANLKPVPQVEVPGQVEGSFSEADWSCVSVCSLCSALSVTACPELSNCYDHRGPINTSTSSHKGQVISAVPCVDCPRQPSSVRLLESAEARACPWL